MTRSLPAITIDEIRWAEVQKRGLDTGAHDYPSEGMSAIEAAAYIAGDRFTDHPECVCPVIAAFMRPWNDSLPAAERNGLLLPLLPKVVGTRNKALEERRSLKAADWLIRTHTVAWLRLAGLNDDADALAGLPEITSMAQFPSIRGPVEAARTNAAAARDAAGAAAWAAAGATAKAAAWVAAWDAAWDAATVAAWVAAWDAATVAARDAAWATAKDAARDAAGAAAWDAAGAAAKAKLADTRAELQQSAVLLVERMCALTDASA